MTPALSAASGRAHDHAVSVYDDDADLIASLAAYLLDRGLRMGNPGVVVATREHVEALDTELRRRGVEPDDLRAADYLRTIDAQWLLDQFLVDGFPDPGLFAFHVGGLVRELGQDGPVTAFGEMVALLWAQGSVRAALQLESLWNDLADELDFSLLCAYPTASIATHPDLQAVSAMCELHNELLPPQRYRSVTTDLGVRETAHIFLAVPQAIAGVRRWLTETLGSWGEPAPLDDLLVAASELATNAVLHAQSAFRASLSRGAGVLRISFEDLADSHPALNSAEHELLGGRGVHLVEKLAQRWGVDAHPGGKVVWAEFHSTG